VGCKNALLFVPKSQLVQLVIDAINLAGHMLVLPQPFQQPVFFRSVELQLPGSLPVSLGRSCSNIVVC
jgi:hypothetical protein